MKDIYNPKKQLLVSYREWTIKPHMIRSVYKFITEQRDNETVSFAQEVDTYDGNTYPKCEDCKKPFERGDLYFYCITAPIRIRNSGYGKICVACGEKHLKSITPAKQLQYFNRKLIEAL